MKKKQGWKGLKAFAFSAVTLAMSAAFQSPVSAAFSDTTGHWAENAITTWAERGVVGGWYNAEIGSTIYEPDDPITRGQMATILGNIMGYHVTVPNTFNDLVGNMYATQILKLNAAGLMTGYDGFVRPDDEITRQEAAVMIANAFHLGVVQPSSGSDTSNIAKTTFSDNSSIAWWAANSVAELAKYDALPARSADGSPDSRVGAFLPEEAITRAEAVYCFDMLVEEFLNDSSSKTFKDDSVTSMVIRTPNVTVSNTTITGAAYTQDLILAEGIADGDVYLTDVAIDGNLIIKGGSVNTVYLDNVSIEGTLEVSRIDKPTLVVILGDSEIPQIDIYHNCVVDATELSDDGYVKDVDIYGEDEVTLRGPFESVTNHATGMDLTISGDIGSLDMNASGTVNGTSYGAGTSVNVGTIPGTSADTAPSIYVNSVFPNNYSNAFISMSAPNIDLESGDVELLVYVSSLENCVLMDDPENAITVSGGSNLSITVEEWSGDENTFGTYVYKVAFNLSSNRDEVILDVNFKTDDGIPDVTIEPNFDSCSDQLTTSASVQITDSTVVLSEDGNSSTVTLTLIVTHMENCRLPSNSAKAVTIHSDVDEEDYPAITVLRGSGSTMDLTSYQVTFVVEDEIDSMPLQVNFIDEDGSDYADVSVTLNAVLPDAWEDEDGDLKEPSATLPTTVDVVYNEEEETYEFIINLLSITNCKIHPDLIQALTLTDEDEELDFEVVKTYESSSGKTVNLIVTVPYDEELEEIELDVNFVLPDYSESSFSVTSNPTGNDITVTAMSDSGDYNVYLLVAPTTIEIGGVSFPLYSSLGSVITLDDEDSVEDWYAVSLGNGIYQLYVEPVENGGDMEFYVNYNLTNDFTTTHNQTVATTTSVMVGTTASLADLSETVDVEITEDILFNSSTRETIVTLTVEDKDTDYKIYSETDLSKVITLADSSQITGDYTVTESGAKSTGTHTYIVEFTTASTSVKHVDLVVMFEPVEDGKDTTANLNKDPVDNDSDFGLDVGKAPVESGSEENVLVSTLVTVTPDPDKELESVIVRDSDGEDISSTVGLKDNKDGTWEFVMPNQEVSVEVNYVTEKDETVHSSVSNGIWSGVDIYIDGEFYGVSQEKIGSSVADVATYSQRFILKGSLPELEEGRYEFVDPNMSWYCANETSMEGVRAYAQNKYVLGEGNAFEISVTSSYSTQASDREYHFELWLTDTKGDGVPTPDPVVFAPTLAIVGDGAGSNTTANATISLGEDGKTVTITLIEALSNVDYKIATTTTGVSVGSATVGSDHKSFTFEISDTNGTLSGTVDVPLTLTLTAQESGTTPDPVVENTITVNQTGGTGTVTLAQINPEGAITSGTTLVEEGSTFSVTPSLAGYTVKSIVAKDANGVELTNTGNTSVGIFTMPSTAVTIAVEYEAVPEGEIGILATYNPTSLSEGNVSVDKSSAKVSDTVTITVTPVTGYTYTVTVKDINGNTINATNTSGDIHTFVMTDVTGSTPTVYVTVDYTPNNKVVYNDRVNIGAVYGTDGAIAEITATIDETAGTVTMNLPSNWDYNKYEVVNLSVVTTPTGFITVTGTTPVLNETAKTITFEFTTTTQSTLTSDVTVDFTVNFKPITVTEATITASSTLKQTYGTVSVTNTELSGKNTSAYITLNNLEGYKVKNVTTTTSGVSITSQTTTNPIVVGLTGVNDLTTTTDIKFVVELEVVEDSGSTDPEEVTYTISNIQLDADGQSIADPVVKVDTVAATEGTEIEAQQTLTVTPATSSTHTTYVNVTGADRVSTTDGVWTYVIDGDKDVTIFVYYVANNSSTTYTLTATAPAYTGTPAFSGSFDVTDPTAVSAGTQAILTLTYDTTNYRVKEIKEATSGMLITEGVSFGTLAQDMNFVVTFEEIYAVTTSIASDSATDGGTMPEIYVSNVVATGAATGDTVVIRTAAADGYVVTLTATPSTVSLQAVVGSTTDYSFIMPSSAVTVEAKYEKDETLKNISKVGDNQDFSLKDSQGTELIDTAHVGNLVHISPPVGKAIGRVTVTADVPVVVYSNSYFTMPNSDATVEVDYKFTLIDQTNDIKVVVPTEAIEGVEVTIDITGYAGLWYSYVDGSGQTVKEAATVTGAVTEATFTMPSANTTITVAEEKQVSFAGDADTALKFVSGSDLLYTESGSTITYSDQDLLVDSVIQSTGAYITSHQTNNYRIRVTDDDDSDKLLYEYIGTGASSATGFSYIMPETNITITVDPVYEIYVEIDTTTTSTPYTGSTSGYTVAVDGTVITAPNGYYAADGETIIVIPEGAVGNYSVNVTADGDGITAAATGTYTFEMGAKDGTITITYEYNATQMVTVDKVIVKVDGTEVTGYVAENLDGTPAVSVDGQFIKIDFDAKTFPSNLSLDTTLGTGSLNGTTLGVAIQEDVSGTLTDVSDITLLNAWFYKNTDSKYVSIWFTVADTLTDPVDLTISIYLKEEPISASVNWVSSSTSQGTSSVELEKTTTSGEYKVSLPMNTNLTGSDYAAFNPSNYVSKITGATWNNTATVNAITGNLEFTLTGVDPDKAVSFDVNFGYEVTFNAPEIASPYTTEITVGEYYTTDVSEFLIGDKLDLSGNAINNVFLEIDAPITVVAVATPDSKVIALVNENEADYVSGVNPYLTHTLKVSELVTEAVAAQTPPATLTVDVEFTAKTEDVSHLVEITAYEKDGSGDPDYTTSPLTGVIVAANINAQHNLLTGEVELSFTPPAFNGYELVVVGTDVTLYDFNITTNDETATETSGTIKYTIASGYTTGDAITFDLAYSSVIPQNLTVSGLANNALFTILVENLTTGQTLKATDQYLSNEKVQPDHVIKMTITNVGMDATEFAYYHSVKDDQGDSDSTNDIYKNIHFWESTGQDSGLTVTADITETVASDGSSFTLEFAMPSDNLIVYFETSLADS